MLAAFRAEQIISAVLQGVELGDGPVQCTLHHGPSDVVLTLRLPGGETASQTKQQFVEIWLDGDLPGASYRAELQGRVVREGQLACWLDHTGTKLLGPAPADQPTGFGEYDRLTHRIMRPNTGQLIQAISWCGRRVHEVPGRGPVDCRECIELVAEDEAARRKEG